MYKIDKFFEQNKQFKLSRIQNRNLRNMLFIVTNFSRLQGVFNREGLELQKMVILLGEPKVTDEIIGVLTTAKEDRIPIGSGAYTFRQKIEGKNDRFLVLDVDLTSDKERKAKENVRYLKGILHDTGSEINFRHRIVPIIPVMVMIPQIGIEDADCLMIPVCASDVQSSPYVLTEKLDFFANIVPILEEQYSQIRRVIKKEKEEFRQEADEALRTLKIVAGVSAFLLDALVGTGEASDFREELLESLDSYRKAWESNLEWTDLGEVVKVRLKRYIKTENVSILDRFHVDRETCLDDKNLMYKDETYYYFDKRLLNEVCGGELSSVPMTRILNTLKNEGVLKRTKSVDSKDLTIVTTLFYEDGTEQRKRFVAVTRAFVDGD